MLDSGFKIAVIRFVAGAVLLLSSLGRAEWKPAEGPLMTRWAEAVSPENVHPEYPRPQMVRKEWLNLNGLWDYAIRPKDAGGPQWRGRPALGPYGEGVPPSNRGKDAHNTQGQDALATNAAKPDSFDGQILVPFPVESALSGVMKPVGPDNRLWYRRTFLVPERWNCGPARISDDGKPAVHGNRLLLHFGAVDWDATVWVNGKKVGNHEGGYDPFTFDITDALKESGEQQIVLSVWDPTDAGSQPRGKQVRKPGGIMYTAVTGIWQTVWLEPVNRAHIKSLRLVPRFDESSVEIEASVYGAGKSYRVQFEVKDGSKPVEEGSFKALGGSSTWWVPFTGKTTVRIGQAKPWTPDSPFLYDVRATLYENDKIVDQITGYFGMRKTSLGKDENGILRLCLNDKSLFQYGPLDQGWWPDGLYTAPTDEALRYDIEVTKRLGMNMARKHVKVEPARWYYWCDKLGLLVWQDMPSGDRYIGRNDPDIVRTEESAKQFDLELTRIIQAFGNHPSIVMWVPFNEGWGQYDTPRIVDLIKKLDPTRLVNNASGWTDRGVGDVLDIHRYPGPAVPPLEENRAIVLGEFGGLGLPVPGHTWQAERNWGYRSFTTADELTDAYLALIRKLHPMTGAQGLAAAVYTQTTDVEVEVNGLMTYDRAMIKMDAERVAAANTTLYTPPEPRRAEGDKLIPPATPLIACDPYFSIWSPADRLTDEDTVHWTGKPHRLTSMVRIDGKPYRIMGATPGKIPPMKQTSLAVLPTRTIYTFEGAGVALTLTFMTPALPEDIDLLSRPVTYLTWDLHATDGKKHAVKLYFDAASELVVNEPRQEVTWEIVSREKVGGPAVIKIGSKDQPVLAKRGDDIRIDWGYLYVTASTENVSGHVVASASKAHQAFAAEGRLPTEPDNRQPRAVSDEMPVCAITFDVGEVAEQPLSCWLTLAYDDIYSIQYMKKNLRPYWRRDGDDARNLVSTANSQYESLKKRCAAFDEEVMADLAKAGGEKYAKLAALAYRQCFAAGKFVADDNGQPLQFCKENHSNGCIGTSDVFYPMSPQFLLFGPSVAKSFLVPFMNYAASDRWKFPFAPHDLGQYPHANGQRYGGGERSEENQMPVEESGNLLILMAAVAQMEGNAKFAGLYWPQLERWAEYLRDKGFDPENQLCTDDFAGHLAHNVNLSAKAICGLGAFAKLCDMRGETAKAAEYSRLAKQFAARWMKEADDGPQWRGRPALASRGHPGLALSNSDASEEQGQDALATGGDHYRLAFDKSGTWSQKYNLVWDRILGLNLFDREIARKEMAFYRKTQNKYGLPLDNRSLYTKLDWILWTATLTQDRDDFEALVEPVYRFLNETPDRMPMTDWYFTHDARRRGFTARPVVGGVFLQMLYDKAVWRKYAGRDKTKAAGWAPMPKPPVLVTVVPTAQDEPVVWRYTTRRPASGWFEPDFDAGTWREGKSGFGTRGTPGAIVNTVWDTRNIWLRREFTLPEGKWDNVGLNVHHDEDVEIYINGVRAADATGYTTDYEPLSMNATAQAALKPGRNVIAVHCRQTGGGQYIDVGIVEIIERAE